MATSEYNIESIVILCLAAQAGLAGLSIKHHDEDTDAAKDRVVVRCEPREVLLNSSAPFRTAVMYQADLSIEIHVATRTASLVDTYGAAVDLAMNSAAPAGAIAAADAAFSSLYIEADESGTRQEDGAETYIRTKNYKTTFS